MKNFALPIRFGVVISACLIAFFLLLSLFGDHSNPLFSLFNGVITALGIYEAIRVCKLERGRDFSYTNGFEIGLTTGGIATLIFTLFFALYVTEINPEFITVLLDSYTKSAQIGAGIVVFTVAVMGLATTVVLTLTFMQLFKSSRNIVTTA